MSSTDAAKFEQVAASFSSAFGIFTGGEMAFGKGSLLGDGATQLNELDSYINSMGMNQQGTEDVDSPKTDAQKEAEKEQMEASEQLAEKVEKAVNESPMLEQAVELNYTSQYVQLTIQGALLFDSGKVQIKDDAKPILDKVGQILESYAGGLIELSSGRAQSVFDYLISHTDLDPAKIKHSGRGEYVPVADNSVPEGRARNRRVEIRIYNPKSPLY